MFGQFGTLMKLMGNKDKIAEEAAKLQAKTAEIRAEGTAQGLVTVTVSGRMEVLSCDIVAEAFKLENPGAVGDLVMSATNMALSRAREQLAALTKQMATDLGLPPEMLGSIPGLS